MWINLKVKAKWRLIDNNDYVWTECRKLVNVKKCIEIKKTRIGNSVKPGYYIKGKFIKCEDLKNNIELIPKKEYLPF